MPHISAAELAELTSKAGKWDLLSAFLRGGHGVPSTIGSTTGEDWRAVGLVAFPNETELKKSALEKRWEYIRVELVGTREEQEFRKTAAEAKIKAGAKAKKATAAKLKAAKAKGGRAAKVDAKAAKIKKSTTIILRV